MTKINYEKIASDDVKFAIQRQEAQGTSESICNILQGVAASNFEYWYSVACELNIRKMFYEGLDCLQIAEEFIDTAEADFSLTPSCRTADKKSGGSETKRGLRRISGVGGYGVSQEPITKSPAWCGALSACQPG